jgi:hypothetical protein
MPTTAAAWWFPPHVRSQRKIRNDGSVSRPSCPEVVQEERAYAVHVGGRMDVNITWTSLPRSSTGIEDMNRKEAF